MIPNTTKKIKFGNINPIIYGTKPKTIFGNNDIKTYLDLLIDSTPVTNNIPCAKFVYKYTSSLKQIACNISWGKIINIGAIQPEIICQKEFVK